MNSSPISPPVESRSSYHHGNLGPSLVEAGIRLLEEQGVTGLTLRQIARRAGVSHGAPYHHFSDRQALLAAVATAGFRMLGESIASATEAIEEPRDRLRSLARRYLAFAAAHPALYRLMYGGEIQDRAAHPELVAADDAIISVAREVTAACLGLSSRRPVSNEIASAAGWALAHGLADLLIDGHVRLRSGRSLDAAVRGEIIDLFLDALIPEEALDNHSPPSGDRGDS